MVTVSILYSNLGNNMGVGKGEITPSGIRFTEFSITNKWIGLISR